MKKYILILLAAISLLIVSCKNTNTKKALPEDPFTELIGELDPKWEGDSIKIFIQDGANEDYSAYPIVENKFDIQIPTDKMKLGGFVISYDGGLVGRYFIPEGGTINVHLDPRAKITVVSDKENSLTEQYHNMTKELEDLKYGMVRENNAKIKDQKLSNEQADSLRAIAEQILMDKLKEQSYNTLKTNKDNILAAMSLLNLSTMVDAKEFHKLYKKTSPEVQNFPAIPDSLKIKK